VKYIILLFCCFVYGISVNAQSCTFQLSGTVSDVDTKQPLELTSVLIKETGKYYSTDANGFYKIDSLCSGTYTLVLTHIHCLPLEVKVKIDSNRVRNFLMPHTYNQLQEIVIENMQHRQPQLIKSELSKSDIAQTRGMTLGEILRKADGVTVLQTGSTIYKPVIHGLHSQRVLILNNGVRQEGQQWGSEHAPEVDPFIADKFTVLKGAGALQYGADAIGGAILVEPKSLPRKPGFNGEFNSIFFSNNRMGVLNMMLEQNLPKHPAWSWRSHVTYKKGGNTRTPDYWLYNTGVEELNYSANVGYKKDRLKADLFFSAFNTRLGIFWGSHVGNLNDLQNAIRNQKPELNKDIFSYDIGRPRQEVSHYLLKAKVNQDLTNGDKIHLMLAHQENFRKEYDRALISEAPELDLNIGTTTLDLQYEQMKKSQSTRVYGVMVQRQQNVWSGSRFFIPNFNAWMMGAYAIDRWQWNKIQLEAGLRYDYRTQRVFRNQNNVISEELRSFNNFSATAAMQYKIQKNWIWLVNASLAWRPPSVNELYVNGLHHGTANFEIGDPSLKSERAWNFSQQLTYSPDSNFNVDVTVYSNYIQNFINLIPSLPPTLTFRGAYPTFRFIQTNAWLTGSDIRVRKNFGEYFSIHARASLLLPYDTRSRTWLQQMPAQRADADFVWYIKSDHPKQTSITLNVAWTGRQDLVPKDSKDYLPPPDAYVLTNLEYATLLHIRKNHLNFGISIYNLLNVRYRDYMNRFRYFNDEAGRNIVVRLKIPFKS
jgi:iron complex outermembrane receptor protein